MEPMLAEFPAVVGGLSFAEPLVAVVSTVTGRPVEPGLWSDPEYWVEQVRKPVRFADALAALEGVSRFVEVGPDGVLAALVQQPDAVAVPLLRRERDEVTTALTALATLHVNGVPVDWSTLFGRAQRGRPADVRVPAAAVLAREGGQAPRSTVTRTGSGQRSSAATSAPSPTASAWRPPRWQSLIPGAGVLARAGPGTLADRRMALPRHLETRPPSRARRRLTGTWVLVGDDRFGLAEVLTELGAAVLAVPAGSRGRAGGSAGRAGSVRRRLGARLG